MSDAARTLEASDEKQARRREAIRRLVTAAAAPVVLATIAGNPRPTRAE